jgi:hypothetical protein
MLVSVKAFGDYSLIFFPFP